MFCILEANSNLRQQLANKNNAKKKSSPITNSRENLKKKIFCMPSETPICITIDNELTIPISQSHIEKVKLSFCFSKSLTIYFSGEGVQSAHNHRLANDSLVVAHIKLGSSHNQIKHEKIN